MCACEKENAVKVLSTFCNIFSATSGLLQCLLSCEWDTFWKKFDKWTSIMAGIAEMHFSAVPSPVVKKTCDLNPIKIS